MQGADTQVAQANTTPADTALTVEDVHKRFGSLEVLKGISMTARKGDVTALIGSSGSGKSTFLRCINLLEVPDSGRIEVGGEEVALTRDKRGNTVPADWRQVNRVRTRLGMVFQNFNLWTHMTILENVIEAPVHVQKRPRKEAVERARVLLDKVGPAASSSARRSPGRWRWSRRCCCSTSRPARWTPSWSARCCG